MMRIDTGVFESIQVFLSCLAVLFDECRRVCNCFDSRIFNTSQLEGCWYVSRSAILIACCSLVGICFIIFFLVWENVAGCRNGVSCYFNLGYLHIFCQGISICRAGEIEVKLGNGANQRNRNSFALCLNLCISYVIGYCYVGNGTGNREPLAVWNLCSLSLAICGNAEWIIEGCLLQICTGDAAEILAIQLISHIGTL